MIDSPSQSPLTWAGLGRRPKLAGLAQKSGRGISSKDASAAAGRQKPNYLQGCASRPGLNVNVEIILWQF